MSTVVICTTTDSKDLAYIEYGKIEEPTAASNVEIARSLPRKPSSNNSSPFALPMMMQQAAKRSATELAAARAAEISRKQNPNGVGNDEKEGDQKPRWASMTMITLSYLLRDELIVITLVQVTI